MYNWKISDQKLRNRHTRCHNIVERPQCKPFIKRSKVAINFKRLEAVKVLLKLVYLDLSVSILLSKNKVLKVIQINIYFHFVRFA